MYNPTHVLNLPAYQEKTLTEAMLTDSILETALDRRGYVNVQIQTARDVCYMWMSHAAVWDEELDRFEMEAMTCECFLDGEEEFMGVETVALLCREVQDLLFAEEVVAYQNSYVPEYAVEAAETELNILCDVFFMTMMVATLMVGGEAAVERDIEESGCEGITVRDVVAVRDRLVKVTMPETYTLENLGRLMVLYNLAIRCVPHIVRNVFEVSHKDEFPDGEVQYLPEYNREMLVVNHIPKHAGMFLVEELKGTNATVSFNTKRFYGSLDEIVTEYQDREKQ